MTEPDRMVSVRYMVDDVQASVDFYTEHLGFAVRTNFAPAFADVTRGDLRLLLSGPTSSAGRPMSDGVKPGPGGWNRIHFIVEDLAAEVDHLRRPDSSFATTSSPAPAAPKSCCRTPPATSSSCSNRPAPDPPPAGRPLDRLGEWVASDATGRGL